MNAKLTATVPAAKTYSVVLNSSTQFVHALNLAHQSSSYVLLKLATLHAVFALCSVLLKGDTSADFRAGAISYACVVVLEIAILLIRACLRLKTRYAIKNDRLCAFGPLAESNWQVPLDKLTHVRVVSRNSKRRQIHLQTSYATFIVYGIEDVDSFIAVLPESVRQSEFAHLEERLDLGLDELHAKFAQEFDLSVRENMVNDLIVETLRDFPNAQILIPDGISSVARTGKLLAGPGGLSALYLWRASHHLFWFVTLAVFALKVILERTHKIRYCSYVACADGIYEIDRRRMILNRINLDAFGIDELKDGCIWLRFSMFVEVPMRLIGSGGNTPRLCIKAERKVNC